MAAQPVAAVRRRAAVEAEHPADGECRPSAATTYRNLAPSTSTESSDGRRRYGARCATARRRGRARHRAEPCAASSAAPRDRRRLGTAPRRSATRRGSGCRPGRAPSGFTRQRLERGDRTGHQPLAAGLVDRAGALVPHLDVEAGTRGVERGGEAGGAAADDQQVPHDADSDRRGAGGVQGRPAPSFSTRSRTVSSTALSTVNTTAVIHAECTSGRAKPSTTTAT